MDSLRTTSPSASGGATAPSFHTGHDRDEVEAQKTPVLKQLAALQICVCGGVSPTRVTPWSCTVPCPAAVSFPAAPRQRSQPCTRASTTGGDGAAVRGGHAQPEDLLPSPHPHHWGKKAERVVLAFKTQVINSPQARLIGLWDQSRRHCFSRLGRL